MYDGQDRRQLEYEILEGRWACWEDVGLGRAGDGHVFMLEYSLAPSVSYTEAAQYSGRSNTVDLGRYGFSQLRDWKSYLNSVSLNVLISKMGSCNPPCLPKGVL